MVFYSILFFLSTALLGLATHLKSCSKGAYFLFFAVLFCVAGFRGDVGQDTLSYGNIYASMVDLDALKSVLIRQEPVPNLLMFVHKVLFDSYTGFLVVTAFLQVTLLAYSTRRMRHRGLFLFFYVPIFYLEIHFNVLRVAFAVLFMLAALSDLPERPKRSIVWALLSLFSHVSIVAVFPILALRAGLSVRRIIVVSFSALVIAGILFFVFAELIVLKIGRYEWFNVADFTIPKVSSLLIFILVSASLIGEKIKTDELYCIIFLSIVLFASSLSEIAYRMYNTALIMLLYLVFSREIISFAKVRFQPIALGILPLCIWFSYLSVSNVVLESRRIGPGSGNEDFNYIPYQFFFESQYRDWSAK